jgi:hypothetical protein
VPVPDSQYPSSPAGENQSGNRESEAVEYFHRESLSPDSNHPMLGSQYPSSPPGEDHDATHMESPSSSSDHHCLKLDSQYSTSYAENNQDRNRESNDYKLQTSAGSHPGGEAEQAQTDLFGLAYHSETEYPSDPEFDSDEEDKTHQEKKMVA